MFMKVFSFNLRRRKKRLNDDFKVDFLLKNKTKIYVIEDEGVFCTE